MPIYRQIIDQIKNQIATGVLQAGDKLPSVRELAITLAVNQNTILKVYNELCREEVLEVVRGDGTYVSANKQSMSATQRKKIIGDLLRPAVTQATQLGFTEEQLKELLEAEYRAIQKQREKN